ncbi:MAG: FAD-dependent oxidoreductase [Aureispira sp.]|nr:FAD-dependent oxidoreductase [Aureispira sp.]
MNKHSKVIIIGAGIAGLHAARKLHQQGISVRVLEATDRIGGRIRAFSGLSERPIELGAEEIHGTNSIWFELLEQSNISLINGDNLDNYVYTQNQLIREDLVNDKTLKILDYLPQLIELYEGKDISLQQFLEQRQLSPLAMSLANAYHANESGSSLDRIGIKSLQKVDQKWSSGEDNLVLESDSYAHVLQQRFKTILPYVQLQEAAIIVDYTNQKISVTSNNDQTYTCEKVILTVPITVLQRKLITFTPNLPEEKEEAIQALKMDAGMKIILKFKEQFWPKNMGSLLGGELVPEYWSLQATHPQDHILVAFAMGSYAERLSALGEQAVTAVLEELDNILGDNLASTNFKESYIADWFKEPYIWGAYSYPSPYSERYRSWLEWPIDNRLFFAGEAVNLDGHYGTVHGAMETAQIAVDKILTEEN